MSRTKKNPPNFETNAQETLRRLYAAINQNNIPALLDCLTSDIERIEPEGHATFGTYRGHDAIANHVAQARQTWAEGSCEPDKFLVAGNKVLAFLHVHVRLKTSTDWIDERIADVFTFHEGKINHWESFWETEKALASVGVG